MSEFSFLITIDTEGDGIWSKPRDIRSRNARFLPRFQELCEKFGFKPTYLTNYEMVRSEAFREFGKDVLHRRTGEIGMHLHAWNSPPLEPLTADDFVHQPYLVEYRTDIVRKKVEYMTSLLEDAFGTKMVSHRAGRWALDEAYARILIDNGYLVDCSVTPGISWKAYPGDPSRGGGADYTDFPSRAYFLDPDDIRREGDSPLLELPMTVWTEKGFLSGWLPAAAAARVSGLRGIGRFVKRTHWLRPNGSNLPDLLRIVRKAEADGLPYLEFMLHSSEFMPGGSPTFPGEREIEALYRDMEALFEAVSRRYTGATLQEYHQAHSRAAGRNL